MISRQADISVINKWVDICNGEDDNRCAWCKLYNKSLNSECSKCSLMQINDFCDSVDYISTWMKWRKDKTSKNAKTMLLKCIEAIRTVRRYKDKKFCNEALRRVK